MRLTDCGAEDGESCASGRFIEPIKSKTELSCRLKIEKSKQNLLTEWNQSHCFVSVSSIFG